MITGVPTFRSNGAGLSGCSSSVCAAIKVNKPSDSSFVRSRQQGQLGIIRRSKQGISPAPRNRTLPTSNAEEYRRKAEECQTLSDRVDRHETKAEWRKLALQWQLLADRVEGLDAPAKADATARPCEASPAD